MNTKFIFSCNTHRDIGCYGYLDFTLSIYRPWAGGSTGFPTYRHITLGLRSPLIVYARRHWRALGMIHFDHIRFGRCGGRFYFGPVAILTTFDHRNLRIETKTFGPFAWVTGVPWFAPRKTVAWQGAAS